jgi:hypothetical protein
MFSSFDERHGRVARATFPRLGGLPGDGKKGPRRSADRCHRSRYAETCAIFSPTRHRSASTPTRGARPRGEAGGLDGCGLRRARCRRGLAPPAAAPQRGRSSIFSPPHAGPGSRGGTRDAIRPRGNMPGSYAPTPAPHPAERRDASVASSVRGDGVTLGAGTVGLGRLWLGRVDRRRTAGGRTPSRIQRVARGGEGRAAIDDLRPWPADRRRTVSTGLA